MVTDQGEKKTERKKIPLLIVTLLNPTMIISFLLKTFKTIHLEIKYSSIAEHTLVFLQTQRKDYS